VGAGFRRPDLPATMTALPLAIDRLTKRFGRLTAVEDLTLSIEPGEIFGFLGLNGAGKTTTIRMVLDLLRPTAGRARIFGLDSRVNGRAARALVGYLPGENPFYDDMTGGATLDLLGRLNGRPPDDGRRRRLLDRFALGARDLTRQLREYSTGMKRKLGLVQAFQHDPPLVILDEPSEGLDPMMQEALYALLDDMRRDGRTVFLSSHVLPEVERVCDRIGLLRAGRLALVSTVAEVQHLAPRRVKVVFGGDVAAARLIAPAGSETIAAAPRAWTLTVSGSLGPLLDVLAGMPVADLEVTEPHIEDVLVRYYREGGTP